MRHIYSLQEAIVGFLTQIDNTKIYKPDVAIQLLNFFRYHINILFNNLKFSFDYYNRIAFEGENYFKYIYAYKKDKDEKYKIEEFVNKDVFKRNELDINNFIVVYDSCSLIRSNMFMGPPDEYTEAQYSRQFEVLSRYSFSKKYKFNIIDLEI